MDKSRKYSVWGNPIRKEHTWYVLTDKQLLAQKLRMPKTQFAKHMKLKKEDQCVDTLLLLRMGNKIPMEGVTERKFGAEIEGRTIQRLPLSGIHTIISHQMWTLLHMPARFCWHDPGYASAWQIQKWFLTVTYWMEHRAPRGGARESTQGAEGVCSPIGGILIWTNQYPHRSYL